MYIDDNIEIDPLEIKTGSRTTLHWCNSAGHFRRAKFRDFMQSGNDRFHNRERYNGRDAFLASPKVSSVSDTARGKVIGGPSVNKVECPFFLLSPRYDTIVCRQPSFDWTMDFVLDLGNNFICTMKSHFHRQKKNYHFRLPFLSAIFLEWRKGNR